MTDDENSDEPAGDPDQGEPTEYQIKLTPEQTENLRRAIASFQRSIAPQAKLLSFTFPESMLKNLAAVSGIVEAQQAMLSRTLRPIVEAQAAWRDQLARSFTSDALRGIALAQSNFALIGAELAKNLDFGFMESAARIAAAITEQQSAWLKNLAPALAAMRASFYPPNLRAIEGLKISEVELVVMVDGIPLYGVPRTSTAEALIRADGASERREILGRRWKTISADCRSAVEGCSSGAVAPYVPFAVAALDALDAGHTAAAQALGGSLVDAIITGYFGDDRYKYTPNKKGTRTKDAFDEFSIRQFVAFAPIWQAYQQFFVTDGDKVPATFSRNATAHTVSGRQFNRRNTVQVLMLVCSLLYRLDEEAASS